MKKYCEICLILIGEEPEDITIREPNSKYLCDECLEAFEKYNLKGGKCAMKALSYLELNASEKKYESKQYWMLDVYDFKDCIEFYSQPFKQDLITQLFEGFVLVDNYRGTCGIYCKKSDINTPILLFYINGSYEINGVKFGRLPETLDEFLTDAKRAKFELEWMEID